MQRSQLQGAVKSGESRVEYSTKKHTRQEELFKQNFISANARDEAEAEHKLASEELRRAKENQQIAAHEAKRAGEVLAMRTIRSPFTGVVVEVLLKPGEFGAITFKDPILKHVQAMNRKATPYIMLVGFRWQAPTGSTLLQNALQAMMAGQKSPEQVGEEVTRGLSAWFELFRGR